MSFILDTNVVSEMRNIRSGRAHPRLKEWAESQRAVSLFLSVITLQELEIGILLLERRDSVQGAQLRNWLENQVLPAFQGRILSVDGPVARQSARLHVPDPRPFRDSLIAATALVHGLTVVTRNIADFEPLGVCVVNPWEF